MPCGRQHTVAAERAVEVHFDRPHPELVIAVIPPETAVQCGAQLGFTAGGRLHHRIIPQAERPGGNGLLHELERVGRGAGIVHPGQPPAV